MKKILSTILTLCLFITTCIGPGFADENIIVAGDDNTIIFVDVADNHWAKNDIYYFQSQGIVNGVGDNKFDPNGGVTREQFATMLVKAFDAPISVPDENTFTDLTSDHWSYIYVETCKDFLTGYYNVFGGKPSFRPSEYATREDITVALVKMMGISDSESESSNYAEYKFSDSNDISPKLMKYVSVAAEQGLISGYPDGTFGPGKGITRAEAVALISKATKQSFSDINKAIALEVDVITGKDEGSVFINITSQQGVGVSVDGQTVKMSSTWDHEYEGVYTYKFSEEGSKTFVVEGSRFGKSTVKEVTYVYEIGKPILKITTCPTTASKKEVTISGSILDKKYDVELLINGETVASNSNHNYEKHWSKSFVLVEGANNFEFVLRNSEGKETKVNKVVTFVVEGPKLNITSCPTSVKSKEVTLRGTIEDKNYTQELLINGDSIVSNPRTNYAKSWSKSYTLKEGTNTFNFLVKNSQGKEVTLTKVIEFSVGGPDLKITSCPTAVTNKEVTLKGTMEDVNSETELMINGASVATNTRSNYKKTWSKTYTLKEGKNTFDFVLTNGAGKEMKMTKVIEFTVGGPVLNITTCPSKVTTKDVTIRGNMIDENYGSALTINGESISSTKYANYSKSWSKSYTLKEGDNTFEFVVTNDAGKTVRETRVIAFEVSGPELNITECPVSVTNKEVMIRGNMMDKNYSTELQINGKSVASNSSSNYSKNWYKSYTLDEGENTFEFVLTNGVGKEVRVTKVITFEVGAPELIITSCPTSVTNKEIYITGTMEDENYATELLINGTSVATNSNKNYAKMWSKTYTLVEGDNTFEFVLKNSKGKEVVQSKVITLVIGPPKLTITTCPTKVTSPEVDLAGTMVDDNYGTELLINGESIASNSSTSYDKPWYKSYTLVEGENTFEFVLKSTAGKETKETRTIIYEIEE